MSRSRRRRRVRKGDPGLRKTPRGWPRPIRADGWPIPWILGAPWNALKHKDARRDNQCATGSYCQVCGVKFRRKERAFGIVRISNNSIDEPGLGRLPANWEVEMADNAICHKKCWRLAFAYCPNLKDGIAKNDIRILRVPCRRGMVIPGSDAYLLDIREFI